MAKIRCGRGHYHTSVAEVRACYNGERVTDVTPERSADAEPKPTEPQISYLERLLKKNGVNYVPGIANLTKRTISPVINKLKAGDVSGADFEPTFNPANSFANGTAHIEVQKGSDFDPETLEDGFYFNGGSVYKVIVAVHGSGRKYAKRLEEETGSWEMAPGAVRTLRPEMKLTLEDALKVAKVVATNPQSQLYGRCFKCGRVLTDEDSIERFMGPVCAESFA